MPSREVTLFKTTEHSALNIQTHLLLLRFTTHEVVIVGLMYVMFVLWTDVIPIINSTIMPLRIRWLLFSSTNLIQYIRVLISLTLETFVCQSKSFVCKNCACC